MDHKGEPMEGVMGLEELPQMDGTCDACEPDEAQLATQLCHTCSFAFCCLHGDRHASSTHHPLMPYKHDGTHANGVNSNTYSVFGSGAKEETLMGLLNEQDMALRQAALGDESGDDMNGHESKNRPELGAEVSEDGQENMAAIEAVKRDTVTVARLRCLEHGQDGSLYCKPDEKIICVVCAVQGEHQGHEIITLHDAYIWQKNRHCCDLLDCTRQMEEKISNKWTNPEMSAVELEAYVSRQFDALRRLVHLEEKRTLHLVDLKEASLLASAAEKIAEINVQTERLQEEMASITQQLCLLDKETIGPSLAAKALAEASGPSHKLPNDFEPRPRLPVPRADPVDPQDYEVGGSGPSMDHAHAP
ncbi:tripartite motif-containing protein 44 [Phyllopteryx taeniolatus]|uniref:tripartite motif-containing protein 44 n=1 Tax=Phyllopteryx taeniolatus TaxID=161469 RepID=UPI002AD53BF0|nr:tripartite motif-containing protein 44 [Phyllopteryx taeniolatus]XP_061629482.1 tripartite motif-containing protein 44 [Phyllopteryx taeniolatus]